MSAPGKLVRSSQWKSGPSKGRRPLGSECCVTPGDSGCEAYTAIAWSVGLRLEDHSSQGLKVFIRRKAICGAPPCEVLTPCQGQRPHHVQRDHIGTWGGLGSDRNGGAVAGPHREGEEPSPIMHGREKSNPAIVAMKPTNDGRQPTAEPVERTAGPEGNADQRSTYRTQGQERVSQALARVRKAAKERRRRGSPRSSTMSASTCSKRHSSNSRRTLRWASIG